MLFPERPTCHDIDSSPFTIREHLIWRPADWREQRGLVRDDEPYKQTFRTCGYCGSIHPEDLLFHLERGATLASSDYKYGWPHKFYVEGIPNPLAGKPIPSYVTCGLRDRLGPTAEQVTENGHTFWREKTADYPAPAFLPAKWYNIHLTDAGFDDEARGRLIEALYRGSGIMFNFAAEGKLFYART